MAPEGLTFAPDQVFRSWDHNLSSIKENMEIHPIMENMAEIDNAVWINTVYVNGGDSFWVEVHLGGHIECEGLNIGLSYDPDTLTYLGYDAQELFGTDNEEKGFLEIPCTFSTQLSEDTVLAKLHFQAKKVNFLRAVLVLDPVGVRNTENGEEVKADTTSVNGWVYIY